MLYEKAWSLKYSLYGQKWRELFLKTKDLYLEAYSCGKNSNIIESASGDPRGQDKEEVLINFWEEELGYVNVGTVEIKRVHLPGNEAKRYWRRTASNTGMISSL